MGQSISSSRFKNDDDDSPSLRRKPPSRKRRRPLRRLLHKNSICSSSSSSSNSSTSSSSSESFFGSTSTTADLTVSYPFLSVREIGNAFAARYPKHAASIGSPEILNINMPLLYALARSSAWGAVGYRCQTHPDEASVVDFSGDTVLHWACAGRCPVDTVEYLLGAHPPAVFQCNQQGQTPLHVACAHQSSPTVVALLLQRHPDATSMATRLMGSTPLHLVCDHATVRPETIGHLLQVDPTVATREDRLYGSRPLTIWYLRQSSKGSLEQYRDELRVLRREHPLDDRAARRFLDTEFWQIAALLLGAEAGVLPKGDLRRWARNPAVLLAAVGNRHCPPALQEWAILLFCNELATARNERGQLALHVAAQARCASAIQELVYYAPETASVRWQGDLPLSLLLSSAPNTCLSNESGEKKNSCHENVAWEHATGGKSSSTMIPADWLDDGVGYLVQANPTALHDTNIPHSWYPEIWSRLSADALYKALQSSPQVWVQ